MKKRLSVLVLAFAMVLTMSVSVFADDAAKATAPDGAYLVKVLEMADGVALPETNFTFNFAADSGNYTGSPATFDYSFASSLLTADTAATDDDSAKVGKASISTIFSGKTFASAGVYSYIISETAGNTTPDFDNDAKTTEKMVFDGQKYQIDLYVVNNTDTEGKPIAGTHIEKVGLFKVTVTTVGGETVVTKGEKVDPTVTDPTDTTQTQDKGTGFSFTNSYHVTKTDPVEPPQDPENPETGKYGVLGISKKVTGQYGDKNSGFNFSITLVAPANYDPAVDPASFSYTKADGSTGTLTFVNGTATVTDSIAHGESLSFASLPAGTKYTITEDLANSNVNNKGFYTPSVKVGSTTTPGTKGANLSTEQANIDANAAANANTAFYTNDFADQDITPTGIIINNLPYVLLIGIALGGIVLFSRKRRYE